VTCLKTGTSSVCQFYDSPRQLICFLRTFFRVRKADLLKSTVGPIVVQNCAHGLPRLPGSYSIHKQFFRQTHCFTYIVVGQPQISTIAYQPKSSNSDNWVGNQKNLALRKPYYIALHLVSWHSINWLSMLFGNDAPCHGDTLSSIQLKIW
jgi:hypothetical protein